MPPAASIAVTPSLLTWAREESGYAPARVAKRLNVKEERLLAWESGERQPTLKQVENLARVLHRPLSLFFMPQPPQLPPLAAEHRRLPGVEPGHETPELRLAIRQMVTRRENTLNLMGELGDPIVEFTLSAHLRESPVDVGQRLRAATGVDIATQLAWPDEYRTWAAWRAAVERLGVLVFQFGKVALEEARGVALLRAPLPAVGVNGKELPEAKAYTLLHEVVHLMLAAGHEETSALNEKRSDAEWAEVEDFVDIAASSALVARIPKFDGVGLPALRFETPAEKALDAVGRPFAQLVLTALSSDRLTAVDAARYLGLRFEHFDELRRQLADPSISPRIGYTEHTHSP